VSSVPFVAIGYDIGYTGSISSTRSPSSLALSKFNR
jgi:hypothetical protein